MLLKNVIFLGPPGSGKGTHAEKVSQSFGIPRLSTGDMLREQIKANTKLGMEAKKFMDAGQLVPDEIILGMVDQRLQEPDCANGCIFDGFPRTEPQAAALAVIVAIGCVVNMHIADEAIVERMQGRRVCPVCGHTSHLSWMKNEACDRCNQTMVIRADDMPETVLNRLRVYHAQTKPLIDYYTKQGVLHTVDADGDVMEVAKRVYEALV